MRRGFVSNNRPVRVPDYGAGETDIRSFRDAFYNYDSRFRCRRLSDAAESLNYVVANQWIDIDPRVLLPGNRTYFWREMQEAMDEVVKPKPTTNYSGSAGEVELAALLRRKLVSVVVPNTKDPRDRAASRAANEILEYRHKAVAWPAQRFLFTFLKVVTGLATMRTFWDELWTEMTKVPSPEAVKCQTCGYV